MRATLPASEFTLAWRHSVEKTRWEERYRADGTGLRLTEARVEGSGAGMEPPPEAILRHGAWVWHPDRRVAELVLARHPAAGDYTLCWRKSCRDLTALVGSPDEAGTVTIRPCPR